MGQKCADLKSRGRILSNVAKLFHSIPKFCQPTGINPICTKEGSSFSPWINISHLAKLTAIRQIHT